ncbi:MAG: hypothetical protein KME64_43960 [Scytonematopsis contorta HA4267-MV1]|jgi:hypothetical protein|nr:hypothetical protein [Scytonematopsis contorta HA4267-MV1]
MRLSEARPDTNLLQRPSENTVCEAQVSPYTVDCYPYAVKGLLWGIVFSVVLWVILIGLFMLVF